MSPDAQLPPGRGRQSPDNSGGGKSKAQYTPRGTRRHPIDEVDPDYDEAVPDLEGYETDPLTADVWAAMCRDADRGRLAEVEW